MAPTCQICGGNPDTRQPADVPDISRPTNVEELLNSYRAPIGDEEAEINSLCDVASQELADLESQIGELRGKLASLVQKRATKEREVKDYKIILHPLRRLSPDILGEIVIRLINEDLEADDDSSLDPKSPLWVIPRVSSQWRSVALSYHRVWSTIRITGESFRPTNTNTMLRKTMFLLGVQLHRSGSHPLSVSLNSTDEIEESHPILQILLPSSPRWRDLHVWAPCNTLNVLSPIGSFLPSLKSLHLWASDEAPPIPTSRNDQDESDICSTFELCPELTQLYGDPRLIATCSLPWAQITEYVCESHGTNDHLAILPRMPNLRSCKIIRDIEEEDEDGNSKPSDITLKSVEHLILHDTDDDASAMLTHLTIPGLRSLEIRKQSEIDALIPFLQRSKCTLRNLSLRSRKFHDVDCLRLLESVPSLTSLTLKSKKVYTEGFLQQLITDKDIVPSLESLQLLSTVPYKEQLVRQLKEARPGIRYSGGRLSL